MQEYFEIGQIVNTSGLKGVIKVNPYTDDVTKFEFFKKILVEKKNKLIEYEIEEVRYQKNQVLLKLKGIDTIEQAEEIRNCLIKVRREDEPDLPEDTYYIVDLIGLEVFTEEGESLGTVKDIFPLPGDTHDVYVVQNGEKEILLPGKKEVIKQIDLKSHKIIVHLIDGLI